MGIDVRACLSWTVVSLQDEIELPPGALYDRDKLFTKSLKLWISGCLLIGRFHCSEALPFTLDYESVIVVTTGQGSVALLGRKPQGTLGSIVSVEGVVIHSPALGRYEVMARAFNVPITSQPYALAVAGPLAETPSIVNDPPVAADDTYITAEDTPLTVDAPGVLDNDSDADGDPLTAVMDSPLAGGTLVYSPSISGTLLFDADGSFIYTPTLGFSGVVSFTYHVHDGTVESNIATVEIMVSEATVFLPIAMRNYP